MERRRPRRRRPSLAEHGFVGGAGTGNASWGLGERGRSRLGPLNPTVEREGRPIGDGRLRLIHQEQKEKDGNWKEKFPLPGFEPGSPG